MSGSSIVIKQLKVGGLDDNFSYLFFDCNTREAGLVDPCGSLSVIEAALESEPNLVPRYILLTHGHHDHTSAVQSVKRIFDATVVAHPNCAYAHEMSPEDREILPFGEVGIECLYTPGHTKDSITYHLLDDSAIFTGDTLFIDYCGYCDATSMFHTMRETLYPLADTNIIYSGHNYGHVPSAPLGDQKRDNPYLAITNFELFKEELRKL